MNTLNVVEAVFFAALEHKTPEKRDEYLNQACKGDANLRRCVERLLNAHPKAESFLKPASASAVTEDRPAIDEKPGTIIGPYKLLQRLGEGGFGVVFLAEQEQPVRRMVALKIIKPGMDSKQVIARFEAERQALALMDHPNIAKVLDAGTTPAGSRQSAVGSQKMGGPLPTADCLLPTGEGRPYFVMELVKGIPITEFCDKNRLSPRERLELFVPVCQAVQHAHQKGVIHRDLKPSNVLVTMYDDKPVPKVIDFGVAKAIEQKLTEQTLFTQIGQVVGTLEYMSPEQASLNALDIDTRADVYALGVILYELLTGTTPLNKECLQGVAFLEMLRLVREEEPPKPSTRLSQPAVCLPLVANYRRTESQKLPKLVRGELDWIAMKALEKDRNRRYDTANALANDVQRYLAGDAVEACPPTLGYRLRKAYRKNRAAILTGAAIAAALLVATGVSLTFGVMAKRAETEAARERDNTAEQRDEAVKLGNALDTRLGEIRAANLQIRRDQESRRRDQYAWDMQLLPITWADGNVRETLRLLDRQRPAPDEADLRGFEWHYWDRITHSELQSHRLDVPADGPVDPRHWAISADATRIACVSSRSDLSEGETTSHTITINVWEVASRKQLWSHTVRINGSFGGPGGRNPYDGRTQLSRDGRRMLVQIETRNPSIHYVIFDIDTRRQIFDVDSRPDAQGRVPSDLSLSPDGRKLLAHFRSGPNIAQGTWAIKMWNLEVTDKEPLTITDVSQAKFSLDGSRLIGRTVTLPNSPVKWLVWDTASGKELLRVESVCPPEYSPDGSRIAGVVEGDDAEYPTFSFVMWDATTGEKQSSVRLPLIPRVGTRSGALRHIGPTGLMSAPLFSPDGSLVAVGQTQPSTSATGPRSQWMLIDVKSATVKCVVATPYSGIELGGLIGGSPIGTGNCYFTPDGKQFVFVDPYQINTYDTGNGQPLLTLRGHASLISACVATPDSQRLWSISRDGMLKEWSLRPSDPVSIPLQFESSSPFRGVGTSADGAWVAVHTPVSSQNESQEDVVEVINIERKASKILKLRPRDTATLGATATYTPQLSCDGKRVAVFRRELPPGLFGPGQNGAKPAPKSAPAPADLTVFDVPTGKELLYMQFPQPDRRGMDVFTGAALFPDGTHVAVSIPEGDIETVVKVIEIETGKVEQRFTIPGGWIQWRYSPDGLRLATTSKPTGEKDQEQLAVWDVAEGKRLWTTTTAAGHPFGWSVDSCWSPDGTRLAQLTREDQQPTIRVYNATTGQVERSINITERGGILGVNDRQLLFSPDGRRIVCKMSVGTRVLPASGQMVRMWDVSSGKEVLTLSPPNASAPGFGGGLSIYDLVFTADGHRLLRITSRNVNPLGRDPERPMERRIQSELVITTWDATPRGAEPKK